MTDTTPTTPAPVDPALAERIARALLTVQLHVGPNAIATAQSGRPIRLSGGEADRGAAVVLAELAPELTRAADHEAHHHALADAVARPIRTPWPDLITAAFRAYRAADLLSGAERERQNAEARITRARELHQPANVLASAEHGEPADCTTCGPGTWGPDGCPTLQALTSPAEETP